MNIITADIGRSLVPVSLQVPKDSDSDGDDHGDDDDVVVQEIGSEGILNKCMIKLKTKAKQLRRRGRRRGRRRALPHFYIQQDLVEFAEHGMEGESKRFGFFITEREISTFLFNH